MIKLIQKLFGNSAQKSSEELVELYQKGASLIDVRSEKEFKNEHLRGALNIPSQELSNRLKEIENLPQPIMVVCRSGTRSAMARKMLSKNNIQAYNAGSWKTFKEKLK